MSKLEKVNKSLIILLGLLAIFGMKSLTNIRIAGMILTPYRLLVPIIFLYAIYVLFCNVNLNRIHEKKIVLKTSIFVCVWILYGGISIFVNNAEHANGAKELLMIILGFMMAQSIIILSNSEKMLKMLYKTLRIIYLMILLGAVIEIIFDWHLDTSKILEFQEKGYGKEIEFWSTSIFYNVNDFSAFLAIFSPLFFSYSNIKEGIINSLILMVSLIILINNDSWIALLSVIIACIIFQILNCITSNKKGRRLFVGIGGFSIILFIAYNYGRKLLSVCKEICNPTLGENLNIGQIKVSDVLVQQLSSDGSGGSATARVETYWTSIKNMFVDTRGMGYGPSNFSAYLNNKSSSELLQDPHSLWVEILVNYGIIIFAIIIISLIVIFIKLIKLYINNNSKELLSLITIDIAYVFASFAPSTFLNYTYQWVIIGASLASINLYSIGNKNEREFSGKSFK